MSDPDPNKPSPYAHLVRLAGILIAAGVAFFFVRQAMIPKSWNFEGWYREDAVKQVAAKPMKHGKCSTLRFESRPRRCGALS